MRYKTGHKFASIKYTNMLQFECTVFFTGSTVKLRGPPMVRLLLKTAETLRGGTSPEKLSEKHDFEGYPRSLVLSSSSAS